MFAGPKGAIGNTFYLAVPEGFLTRLAETQIPLPRTYRVLLFGGCRDGF